MEFVQSVKRNMTTGAYAQITGRASRSEYWWFFLFTAIASGAASALDVLFPGDLLQTLVPLIMFGGARIWKHRTIAAAVASDTRAASR